MAWKTPDLARIVLVFALCSCQDGSDLTEAKRSPKPPPPESDALPQITIAVEVDGAAAKPIDPARLDAVPPEFSEEDRRGWRLATLLGEAAKREGAVLAVSGEDGPEVLLRVPKDVEAPQPALLVSRRGEVVATMVSPQAPFPGYHGRGGRLGRGGDPVPRIVGVRKIRVYLER